MIIVLLYILLIISHSVALSETFSEYSPFETKYDGANYEARMKSASLLKSKTEKIYAKRDAHERKLVCASYFIFEQYLLVIIFI